MSELVISTHSLSKSFGEVNALSGLDLAVPAHSITGFLGPNGAGKSTTIKLLLGLMHPSEGGGSVFGKDIQRESTEIRQRIGYLSQKPRFYDNLTARETLAFVARFFYYDEALIESRVNEGLVLVGLEDKANRSIKGFSGGEMQRLGIAQAQINKPDLLILDEPAAALDPMGRAQVLDIMEQLRDQSTVFYSTHILDDVQRVSDRVVILNQGKMIAQGPIEDLLAGDGEIIYHVTLDGASDTLEERIRTLPYIKDLRHGAKKNHTHWKLTISDEERAQKGLLRAILADKNVNVLGYEKQRFELEDIFMQMVGGAK